MFFSINKQMTIVMTVTQTQVVFIFALLKLIENLFSAAAKLPLIS